MNYKLYWSRYSDDGYNNLFIKIINKFVRKFLPWEKRKKFFNRSSNVYIDAEFTDDYDFCYNVKIPYKDAQFILDNIYEAYLKQIHHERYNNCNGHIWVENREGIDFKFYESILSFAYILDDNIKAAEKAVRNNKLLKNKIILIKIYDNKIMNNNIIYFTEDQFKQFRDDLDSLLNGDEASCLYEEK